MESQSVRVDGPEITAIRAAAKSNRIAVSIGISEKSSWGRTLWNSNLIIGRDGEVKVHHRKLMPTFFEKLTWAPGDGAGLRVADIAVGGSAGGKEGESVKLGMLICGENTNPLARYSLMAQGEQVHISSWPSVWPTREPGAASASASAAAEQGEEGSSDLSVKAPKNYDNVAANRIRAAAHCFEAKCFGIMNASYLSKECIEGVSSMSPEPAKMSSMLSATSQGATMFLDPTGAVLKGFVVNETGQREEKEFLQHEEGVLYAELDMAETIEGKQYHDVVGGYQRLDVFELKVDRRRREPAVFIDAAELPKAPREETVDETR
jgi:predicted amidohydrolase